MVFLRSFEGLDLSAVLDACACLWSWLLPTDVNDIEMEESLLHPSPQPTQEWT